MRKLGRREVIHLLETELSVGMESGIQTGLLRGILMNIYCFLELFELEGTSAVIFSRSLSNYRKTSENQRYEVTCQRKQISGRERHPGLLGSRQGNREGCF